MSQEIIMIYINITNYEKYHSMIETCGSKNVVIFLQTIFSFVLPRKPIITYIFKMFS